MALGQTRPTIGNMPPASLLNPKVVVWVEVPKDVPLDLALMEGVELQGAAMGFAKPLEKNPLIIIVDVSPIENGEFAFVMLAYWSVVVNVILSKYKTPSKPYKAPQFVSGGITRDSNPLARVRGPYYDSCFLQ